jgi:hypothetical protein
MSLHGVTAGRSPHIQAELSPIWSLSKTTLNTDVLGVPVEQWVDKLDAPKWRDKKDDRLMWRGSNTGTYHSVETDWRSSHRSRLVGLCGWEAEGEVDFIPPPGEGGDRTMGDSMLRASLGPLNKATTDIAFSGIPIRG